MPALRQKEEMADVDDLPKEHPHHKWKEGRSVVKALKEPCWEAFSKESEVVKVATCAYYEAYWPNFKQEGSYNLSSTFLQMATSTNLLGTEIHEVRESWGSWKDLWAVNWATKSSPKDIHYFRVVAPTKLQK